MLIDIVWSESGSGGHRISRFPFFGFIIYFSPTALSSLSDTWKSFCRDVAQVKKQLAYATALHGCTVTAPDEEI